MLEAHILERKLFPISTDASSRSTEQTSAALDLSLRTATGSAPAHDEFQEGLEDEPDEYASDAQSAEGVLRRAESGDDQSEPCGAQAALVGEYVAAIRDEGQHRSVQKCDKLSPHSQEHVECESYSTGKSSQIKQRERHAWDCPDSPMDNIFRQTMGALGSPFKMPPSISYDINDSTSQGSSSEEERDVLEDYYDDVVESGQYDDEEEEEVEDRKTPNTSLLTTTWSMCTSAAVVGSDGLSPASSDVEGSSNLDGSSPPVDDEGSSVDSSGNEMSSDDGDDDENYIGVDDLPDDFGEGYLNGHRDVGHSSRSNHHDPDAFELDSLEEQLQSQSSPNAGLHARQPSIDEILIAECLDNLIVLPKGESPLPSPDSRNTRRSPPSHKISTQRTTPEDVKGSPKYRDRDPCTSSDEEDGDITDDEDTNAVHSLVTDAAVASVTGEILDALMDDRDMSDESACVDDGKGGSAGLSAPSTDASFDRGNRHIPPSPYPTDPNGFQGQIPYPQEMVRRIASVEELSGDNDDDDDDNLSSDSSGMYVDPIDLVEQQMSTYENTPSSPVGAAGNLSMRSLTSDDEREEDRRLFNDIMASAPPAYREENEADIAYMSHLMRSTLSDAQSDDEVDLIKLISSHAVGNVSNRLEDILHHAEEAKAEKGVAINAPHLKNFQQRAAAYLASSSDTTETESDIITTQPEAQHTEIHFDAMGLAISGDDVSDLSPNNFGDENLPDFILHALAEGTTETLPVTSSDELNKQFTHSFRELMKYYSSEPAISSSPISEEAADAVISPNGKSKKTKKLPKKGSKTGSHEDTPTKPRSSTPTSSTKKTSKSHSERIDKASAPSKSHNSRAASARDKDTSPNRPRPASAPPTSTSVDTSKHIMAGPAAAGGGREVYGQLTDAVAMARPWNESGSRILTVPTAAPTRLRVRYTSNSATAAAAVEKEKRARRHAGNTSHVMIYHDM